MPHIEYFKEILYMPDGKVYGDGRLIDIREPSTLLPKTAWVESNPNTGTVPYWVTVTV